MNHKLLSAFVVGILSVEARGMDFDGIATPFGQETDPLQVAADAFETVTSGLVAAADGLTKAGGVMASAAFVVYNTLPSSARIQDAASIAMSFTQRYAAGPTVDLLSAAHDLASAGVGALNRKVDETVTRWEREEEFLAGVAAVPQENQPKTKPVEGGWEDVGRSDSASDDGDDDDFGDDASSEELGASGELPKAPPKPDVELDVLTRGAPKPPPTKGANPFGDDD